LLVIEELVIHRLELFKQIGPHVGFDTDSHHVSPITDDISEEKSYYENNQKRGPKDKNAVNLIIGNKFFQDETCKNGKDQIDGGDKQRANHIDYKQRQMRPIISNEFF
jgi:hypothetical protein